METIAAATVLDRLVKLRADLDAFRESAKAALTDPTMPRNQRDYWVAKERAYQVASQGLSATIAWIKAEIAGA